MDARPVINQPIIIRADLGDEFSSRVEDMGDDWLTVAQPLDLPAEHAFVEGTEFMTTWQADNGLYVLPCELVTIHRDGAMHMWDVGITGEVRREQRRAYVRARARGTVTMSWRSRDKVSHEVTGALEDLSEASLRFMCRDRSVVDADFHGLKVKTLLETAEKEFNLSSEVLRVERSEVVEHSSETGPWSVYLIFSDHGKAADDIRQIVFREQLRERNGR
ncbi:hypothetical protein SAMN05892883_3133 [Jatrophihabitans sp. GAS493]|uniref:hypothetical protein n=1 Tax=Jatrophihabitans sp. GAS493 TaxID=1907575 RepID=UPI000BB7D97D|nr:hypothetical protein [Jatrophihabitans sp. GAS493]SOD73943.1 hypothetical protein SAMN05892883_3133 [Jatrophihabitans sp. GAS493]